MSDILIRGMEMPTSCCGCLLAKLSPTGESLFCNYTLSTVPWDDKPFDCPLVPVPEHGRLIDADALTGQMERNLWAIEDKAEKELGFDETLRRGMQYGHAVCVDAVNAAPTIIPADPAKEGEGW